ncbi:RrF2 family transcriptional regulator [Actinophytocola sp. NPDC049390]|uniref:RrF2 family transcriptional regulator n=1 Tax=Actinophytocola sp. NPDC049390 TaxID=3363894 RepID=UPI0037B67348
MRLSVSTDIAFRVLMHAAAHPGRHTIDELATTLAVSRNHLAKVVQRLARAGLLQTTRGQAGGLRIDPEATRRSVGEVVRDFEGTAPVVDCESPSCPLRSTCTLRGVLRRAQEAFYAELDTVLIGDLVRPAGRTVLLELTSGVTR